MRVFLIVLLTLYTANSLNANSLGNNSCYNIYKVNAKPEQMIDKAIFVLIDETTLFDNKLKQQIVSNSLSKIEKNNYIYIAKFSAFINGFYNEKVFDFKMDGLLTEDQRYNERKDTLNKIDKCIHDQAGYVYSKVQASIMQSFLHKNDNIPKSDILYALKDFSDNVISQVKAKEKIVILASDMLENSTISSFYRRGASRLINAKGELKKVENYNLLGNFGGAKVYIIGAGIISSKKTLSYRDPKILAALKTFWNTYFQKSNGKLIEMGQPALKNNIE